MKRIVIFGIGVLALSLVGILSIEAQQRQGMRGPGRMMGGVRVEQVLAFLAFDEKVGVTDDQFLKLRKVLKGIYVKQQEMTQEMQEMRRAGGGDFQKLLEQMTAMREKMKEQISAVLNADQIKQVEEYMDELESSRGGRQGRGF